MAHTAPSTEVMKSTLETESVCDGVQERRVSWILTGRNLV